MLNEKVIRVCEVALSAINQLQRDNQRTMQQELVKEMETTATNMVSVAHEYEKMNQMLEYKKEVVEELLNIAYKKTIEVK